METTENGTTLFEQVSSSWWQFIIYRYLSLNNKINIDLCTTVNVIMNNRLQSNPAKVRPAKSFQIKGKFFCRIIFSNDLFWRPSQDLVRIRVIERILDMLAKVVKIKVFVITFF